MFHNIAEDIAFVLIKNKIIDIEKRDIYIYGIEVIVLNGGLLLVFLIVSLFCGEMKNFWAYLIFFFPLRIFSGGYHAKTSERCFALSTLMYVATIAVTRYLPNSYMNWYWIATGAVSLVFISILAPLINPSNPLNKSQQKRNKIIVYIILFVDLMFFALCCKYTWIIASNELIFIILNAMLLIIGKLKQIVLKKQMM